MFNPVPKVYSAVIQLIRKNNTNLNCNEQLLFRIVKLSFQQRRKTLRNSLKNLNISEKLREDSIFDKRPEMLSGFDFVQIVKGSTMATFQINEAFLIEIKDLIKRKTLTLKES